MANRVTTVVEVVPSVTATPGSAIGAILKTLDETGGLIAHTTPKISLIAPNGNEIVTEAAMVTDGATNESFYHYQTTEASPIGTYKFIAECTATTINGSSTFMAIGKFRLESNVI